jgi:serine/threonine-protein kinase
MPTRIGKYEVIRRLGQGAMGEVFLAKDPLIGREVAIKTIAAAQAQGDEPRERFLREARAAGTLSHPHLVTVHEFGEDQGLLYLVMEYVPGEDLHTLIFHKALPPREILEVLAQVCEGLGYAHQRGVLHRDIKPSNIRVGRHNGKPVAKVMDFGIARVTGSDFTGTGTLLGTFGYMAPEYIQTGKPNPRSDLFAVGVILYEALTGERPFQGDTTATILYRIVHDIPGPVDHAHLDGISPAVQGILSMALAKDPQFRFQSGEDMASALRAALDPSWRGLPDLDATVRSTRPPTPAPASSRSVDLPQPTRPRRPWIAAVGLAAAVVAGWFLLPLLNRAPKAGPLAQARPAPAASEPPAAPAAGTAKEPELPPAAPPAAKPTPTPIPAQALPRPAAPPPETSAPTVPPPRPAISTLDEAANSLERDPQGALGYLDRFLAEDPRNPRAYALKLVAHYETNDFDGLARTVKTLHEQGVPRKFLLAIPRFRQMLKQEAEHPKLPPRLRQNLGEGPAALDPRRQEFLRRRRPGSP